MGRFSSILFLVAVGCGDNLGQPTGPEQMGGDTNLGANAPITPRFVPEVCGVAQWTTVAVSDLRVDMSVAATSDITSVLAVPRFGGSLTGFQIDNRMSATSNGGKLGINESFTSVSATHIANRIVSTSIDAGVVKVNLLDETLGSPQEVAKLSGNFVAKPALFSADGDTVMPIGGDNGLTVVRFDGTWTPTDSQLMMPSKPVTSMTAGQMGGATLVTWSTPYECYSALLTGYTTPTISSRVPIPCANPHIASNAGGGNALVVFEGGGGIRMMHVSHTQMDGDSLPVRTNAQAPRVVFDGNLYWVSFLDVRGDVVVGYIAGDNKLVSMSLQGPQPEPQAYDMQVIDGAPWVFTLDASGYMAHRMCVVEDTN
jgi:hypothetical protein